MDTSNKKTPFSAVFTNNTSEFELKEEANAVAKNEESAWNELLQKIRISTTQELPARRYVLTIGNTYVCSLGNIQTISGGAKARKSFFVSALIGTLLSSEPTTYFDNMRGGLLPNERILFIDTEQDKHDVQTLISRSERIAAMDADTFNERCLSLSLRGYTFDEKKTILESALKFTENIRVVFIDNIRHFVSSINSEEEATMFIDFFNQIIRDYNLCVFVTLHQNKTNEQLRGHIGTELINNSQNVFKITKQNETSSLVESEFSRGKEFTPFGLSIDANGTPYLSDLDGASVRVPKNPNSWDKGTLKARLIEVASVCGYEYEDMSEFESAVKNVLGLGILNARKMRLKSIKESLINLSGNKVTILK